MPVLTLLQQYLPHLVAPGPEQPIELYVTVLGFANGSVAVLDAQTHTLICGSSSLLSLSASSTAAAAATSTMTTLQLRESGATHPIVGLSMDASGSFLAAVDAGGMCTIFEFHKFQFNHPGGGAAPTTAAAVANAQDGNNSNPRTPAAAPAPAESNVFTSFMSAFTGSKTAATQATRPATSSDNHSTLPTVTVSSLQAYRIPYPRNFGTPTTVALDPAYKRRREKAVLVGFADGRLVQTKRGLIFQRRNDAVLHQALPPAPADTTMSPGIQSLCWRGGLVAWAEPSGIRLLNAENLTKIAHVDRPVGARPSLYPSVKDMTARLCFETANRLLVAWGDCLLQLTIRESNLTTSGGGPTATTEHGNNNNNVLDGAPAMVRRRTVQCTMAWELDCIAAGVVPLDENHVAILGLVPNNDDDENNTNTGTVENEVEVQVLSRTDGNVVYSDLLPVLKRPPGTKPSSSRRAKKKPTGESMAHHGLLSTFSVPRMGNVDEMQTQEMNGSEFDPVSLFAGGIVPRQTFRDSHQRWDLSHVSPDPSPHDVGTDDGESNEGDGEDDGNDDDTVGSVDSDDYAFVLRPLQMESGNATVATPPTMWVVTDADAVAVRVRNLDDAITAILDRPAMALQRALRRRAQLRKHKLDDLVNAYFAAVLRIPSSSNKKRLSLRRMKLAASAMPVLLGGNIELWKRWIEALEDLPGALFILRNVLPVRGKSVVHHSCLS